MYEQILPDVQNLLPHDYIKSCTVYTVVQQYVLVDYWLLFSSNFPAPLLVEQQKWYQQILPEVQKLVRHDYIKSCTVYTVVQQYVCVCVCVCVFFPFILDIKFVGRTSRGHTGGRSHRISHPPSFCGACLNFSREKDSAIPSLVDCEVEFCNFVY